jgi:hypothetical protein
MKQVEFNYLLIYFILVEVCSSTTSIFLRLSVLHYTYYNIICTDMSKQVINVQNLHKRGEITVTPKLFTKIIYNSLKSIL